MESFTRQGMVRDGGHALHFSPPPSPAPIEGEGTPGLGFGSGRRAASFGKAMGKLSPGGRETAALNALPYTGGRRVCQRVACS